MKICFVVSLFVLFCFVLLLAFWFDAVWVIGDGVRWAAHLVVISGCADQFPPVNRS